MELAKLTHQQQKAEVETINNVLIRVVVVLTFKFSGARCEN